MPPIDPGTAPTVADLQIIQRRAWDIGHDAGRDVERARVERLAAFHFRHTSQDCHVREFLAAVNSGEDVTP